MIDLGDSPEKLSDDWFLSDLARTIKFAEIRCLARYEVLERLLNLEKWDEIDLDAHLYRLTECQLTPAEQSLLFDGMKYIAQTTERAPAEAKHRAEVVLLRLLRLMPQKLAIRFARPYLDHPRKGRRKWAYFAFRRVALSRDDCTRLAAAFRRTGDRATLPAVTRTPYCVRVIGAEFLLAKLSAKKDRHWRGRVLQALLGYDRDAAISLAERFPWEFVYAVGRSGDQSLVSTIAGLLKLRSKSPDFLSIYAWALGKIGAESAIRDLKEVVGKLRN